MKIVSKSAAHTVRIGKKIAKNLEKADIICLFGPLGSGKTVLTKGLARGLGIKTSKIISPSFVLIREYLRGRLPLYHFDLYRLKVPRHILGLGYEEYLYDEGITVIEWADRMGFFLPKEFLKIELRLLEDAKRLLIFSTYGKRYTELLRKLNEDIRD